jgi:hypothetical protein
MIKTLIDNLKALAAPDEITRLTVAYNATKRNLQAYNEDSSSQKLNNLRASEEELASYSSELQARYLPVAGVAALEWSQFVDTNNKAEVFRFLTAAGYAVVERTFYRHCDQGKCHQNKDGIYTRRLVKQYVEAEGIRRAGESGTEESGPDVSESIRKQKLENEKLEWHNKTAELKFKKDAGDLIEREGVYLELAARYVTLDNAFRQKLETSAPEIIAAVGGDQTRIVEFSEMILTMWDEMLNGFVAVDEFEVLFADEDEKG